MQEVLVDDSGASSCFTSPANKEKAIPGTRVKLTRPRRVKLGASHSLSRFAHVRQILLRSAHEPQVAFKLVMNVAAISSHLVARCKILSYTCSCPIALRLRERRAKEQEFWPAHPPLVCFGAGARGPGSLGLAPVVATASFPLINLPNFTLASLS